MGKTNHRLVLDPVLGCGVPVKISARSDGRIKSYAPFREACAGPYCITSSGICLEEAARFEKIRSERSVKRSEGYVLNPRRAFERGARDLK